MAAIDWGEGWFVLPDGSGVWKADARPCPKCGAVDFAVVRTAAGDRVQCPRYECVRLKAGDRVLGMLDRVRWRITATRAEARARCGN